MPQYLLMINKRKWDRLNVPWLKPNQIQADPLGDLRINEGTLSVWQIEDDLIQLTADQALNLIKAIFDSLEKHRLYDDEVQTRILNAIQKGYLDLHKVNKSLRNKITQL